MGSNISKVNTFIVCLVQIDFVFIFLMLSSETLVKCVLHEINVLNNLLSIKIILSN